MMLHFYKSQGYDVDAPHPDELLEEGIIINGYEKRGWKHAHLAILLRNHGLTAYNQEFKSIRVSLVDKLFETSTYAKSIRDKGIAKITKTLQSGRPVMLSVSTDKGNHVVLGVGIKEDILIYHDPAGKSKGEGAYKAISIEKFKKKWRKLAIFVNQ